MKRLFLPLLGALLLSAAPVRAQTKVNLNAASAAELAKVPGFDSQIAVRILARRAAKGPFKSFDDLMEIQGVTKMTLVMALDHVEIGPAPAAAPEPAAPAPAAPAAPARGAGGDAPPAKKLDLNTASFPQLLMLPEMTPGAAKAIVDYRKKHGAYRSLDDLGAVPGLDKRIVLQLIDQVVVSGSSEAVAPAPTPEESLTWVNKIESTPVPAGTPAAPVDINTADREELAKVPGLGPVAAQRIVEARARSGPFRDVDGLRAIRGLTPAKLAEARPYLVASEVPDSAAPARATVPAAHPTTRATLPASRPAGAAVASVDAAPGVGADGKVNINSAGVDELLSLPRMTREAAMELVAFRQSHGPFSDPHGITKVPTFGEAAYARLKERIATR